MKVVHGDRTLRTALLLLIEYFLIVATRQIPNDFLGKKFVHLTVSWNRL